MPRYYVLVCGVISLMFVERAAGQTPPLMGFADSGIQFAVKRAIEGAAARLATPACQAVFSDFVNEFGARLSTLVIANRPPVDAFGLLRFVDGRGDAPCRHHETLAFTETGSRVIHVCGASFRRGFARDPTTVEIIVIHEFLHALGLGENPPSSRAITRQITKRCGDDQALDRDPPGGGASK